MSWWRGVVEPCGDRYCDSDPCKQMGKGWWERVREWLGWGEPPSPPPPVEPRVAWTEAKKRREERELWAREIHG